MTPARPAWLEAALAALGPRRPAVLVKLDEQRLYLVEADGWVSWPVSTAARGAGSAENSFCTPLGLHRIAEKIGAGCAVGEVLRGRRPTGRIVEPVSAPQALGEDLITSRILWLEGLEPGRNRGPGVDSHARYIYIHGTPEEGLIGRPVSKGCVRMRNADVIELFERVDVGTPVLLLA
ncbi:MAG: peptidase [Gammaproteobacteria bacterium]|nr:MAG: peptidase [Gammaproteobacteria bacterium]